jgi:cobalt/nickel transport protein
LKSRNSVKSRKTIVVILILLTIIIVLFPLVWLKGAHFEGSDSAASDLVHEVAGEEFEPWFDPIIKRLIGGELPAELETLFFCIQTGIGVGVLAFCFGYLVARKKYSRHDEDETGSLT